MGQPEERQLLSLWVCERRLRASERSAGRGGELQDHLGARRFALMPLPHSRDMLETRPGFPG